MGCFQSKKDSGDIHPNVFRVVNVNESGAALWSGQLEITETDLILYREGRDALNWPLASLRRYGFDGEIFSFESGRRCMTGAGIYAFRCRRAAMLFRALQQNIQLRNVIHESLPFQLPPTLLSGSPSSIPRQTLQASVIHRSSLDNGQPVRRPSLTNTRNPAPRSPSSSDILEVMPLYPRPQSTTSQITNVYQVKDFKGREHNNNQEEQNAEARHVYSNDFNRDLAALRKTLRQETALNTLRDLEEENFFLQHRYLNDSEPKNNNNAPLSPTLSNTSEHYAQLNIEQLESARLYMNVAPNEATAVAVFDNFSRTDVPNTPVTPKIPDYSNFSPNQKLEMNSYANLNIGEILDTSGLIRRVSELGHKFSESDTYPSMSPVEELEVNYAVLDIEKNKDYLKSLSRDLTSPESQSSSRLDSASQDSNARGRHLSQSSLERTPGSSVNATPAGVGYTTIDFDKTVALTSVASGNELESRSRHNSNTTCSSPSSERNK